jgi:hypothetical protein
MIGRRAPYARDEGENEADRDGGEQKPTRLHGRSSWEIASPDIESCNFSTGPDRLCARPAGSSNAAIILAWMKASTKV